MKRFISLAIIILSVFTIINLTRSIYGLLQKHTLLIDAQKELSREKEENKKLKEELTRVKSIDFIESVARNKLFLGKPNEAEILLPQPTPIPQKKKEEKKSNIDSWISLFFGEQ